MDVSKVGDWHRVSIIDQVKKAIDAERRRQFVAAIGGIHYEPSSLLQIKPILKDT